MKKLTFFIMAVLCLMLNKSYGQLEGLEDAVIEALSPLSTDPINTGILYERSPEYYPYRHNSGKTNADSVGMDKNQFLFTYGMLNHSHVVTSVMTPFEVIWEQANQLGKSDTIHLSGLWYHYNRFKPEALDQNLVSWDGSHFQDVPGRSESPYLKDSVFAFTALRNEFRGDTVPFLLSSDWLFTNIGWDTNSLEADFDDGNGFIDLQPGVVYPIVYATDSLKRIQVRYITPAGDTLISQTAMMLLPPLPQQRPLGNPPGNYPINPDGFFSNGGVTVHYWYNRNCLTNCIRKPLIILEGFDPLEKNDYKIVFEKYENGPGLLENKYELNEELSKLIHEEDYDIFFINYKNGSDYIQNNAAWVKHAITEINRRKHACGSYEQNVVIGASMGGLVGRWALSEMETSGPDHETELFISIDSPLKGANIPLGMQALFIKMGGTRIFGIHLSSLVSKLKAGVEALNSPAARQMLLYHVNACGEDICSGDQMDDFHVEFQQEFDAKQLSIPHIAIANGSITGEKQDFFDGESLLDWFLPAPPLLIWGSVYASPGNSIHDVYSNDYIQFVLHIPVYHDVDYFRVFNLISYDNAPGGTREFEGGEYLPWKKEKFCFIPTVSALGLDINNPYQSGLNNVATVIQSGQTYLRSYTGALPLPGTSNSNQKHVSFDANSASYLLGNLSAAEDMEDLGVLSDRTYNFGKANILALSNGGSFYKTKSIIDYNLSIVREGRLWVNRDNRIAYTDVMENPGNDTGQGFDVFIRPGGCEPAPVTVTVREGGEIIVGDASVNNTGRLYVMPEATLNVERGGHVLIESGYHTNLVAEGGKINIEEGGMVEAQWGGRILVRKNGILHVKTGGSLRLSSYSSLEIEDGGQLIIDQGANIMLWDGNDWEGDANIHIHGNGGLVINGTFNFTGNGFFQFDLGNELILNHDFILKGEYTRNHRMMRLNEKAHLNVRNYGIRLENGRIDYMQQSQIYVWENNYAYCDNVYFRGADNSLSAHALNATYPKFVFINRCEFFNLRTGVSADNIQGYNNLFFLDVWGSLFRHCQLGVAAYESDRVRISDTDILGDEDMPATSQALWLVNVDNAYLTRSSVMFHNRGSDKGPAIYAAQTPNFVVTESHIDNNGWAVHLLDESNIDILNGSSIDNNKLGLKVDGSAISGMVTMRCSYMRCNGLGLEGEDALLNINDGYNELFNCGNEGKQLMKICYKARPVYSIPAQYNHWDIPDPNVVTVSKLNRDDCHVTLNNVILKWLPTAKDNAGCEKGGIVGDPDNGIFMSYPTTPSWNTVGANPNSATVNVNGSTKLMYQQYGGADKSWVDESVVAAFSRPASASLYQPVAAVTDRELSELHSIFQHMVWAARARIGWTPEDLDFEVKPVLNSTTKEKSDNIECFPNPASNTFVVNSPWENMLIEAIDFYGKIIYKKEHSYKLQLNVSEWSEGNYFLKVTNLETGETKNKSILIQR